MSDQSYVKRAPTLLRDFDNIARRVKKGLQGKYDPALMDEIAGKTRQEFARLIPEIPYIGEKHIWRRTLMLSAVDLALYRTLREHGYEHRDAICLMYEAYEAYAASYPKFMLDLAREYYFSKANQNKIKAAAEASQQRRYPGDWVFSFVEGDGETFDFGVNVTQCAVGRFYKAQGAAELTSCLCGLDHSLGYILGLGFERSQTIAGGGGPCDCRYKKDRQPPAHPCE